MKGPRQGPVEIVAREGVRFTVPGLYGDQRIGGRWSWPDFAGAVAAARSTIQRLEYPGQTPDHAFTRASVALRMSSTYAEEHQHSSGTDRERLRWEVYLDRVVLVPPDQGGLTEEQKASALAAAVGRKRSGKLATDRDMKVTGPDGDNPITDEQIRELRERARSRRPHADFTMWSVCDQALSRVPARAADRGARMAKRNAARARCAKAWNAQHGAKP